MKATKVSVLLALAPFGAANAQTLNSASLSNSDVTIYEADNSSPVRQLSINNSLSPLVALQGTASDAGGNIELFTSSDLPAFDDVSELGSFANAMPTVLTAGFSNGSTVTVSGLNGRDWFLVSGSVYDTSFGVDNLANQWFGDFLGAMNTQSGGATTSLIALAGGEASLFDTFRDNGGFAQMSDPNVSFIDTTDSIVSVGLGGFIDSTNRVAGLIGVSPISLDLAFEDGLQVSEVALVNGEAAYGFEAVDSGVVLDDPESSYSGTYVVMTAVPEPSSSLLVLLAGVAGLARRKR